MIVVTTITSNLTEAVAHRFGIMLTKAYISADGTVIDSSSLSGVVAVDALVARSKEHPHSLGSSSTEMVVLLRKLSLEHDDIVIVLTSRKLSGTYDAANAAKLTLQALDPGKARVWLVDGLATDIAQGIIALYAAVLVQRGLPADKIVAAASALAAAGCLAFIPLTFDYLVKGGRATFLKAALATMIGKLPIIRCTGGELENSGLCSRHGDLAQLLVDKVAEKVGRNRPVWAAVAHGGNVEGAAHVEAALRRTFDVRELFTREISTAIYLNSGPGTLSAAAYPIDSSPWPVSLELTRKESAQLSP